MGEEEFSDDEFRNIVPYQRPDPYELRAEPSNLADLQLRWAKLQVDHDGAEQFARFAFVDCNEVEGVFLLNGDSKLKFAHCGFDANSIEGIVHQSRLKQKSSIL
jgi:hypothetical protein